MADLPLMRGHGVSRSSGVRVVPVADLRRLHQLMLVAITLQVLQVLVLFLIPILRCRRIVRCSSWGAPTQHKQKYPQIHNMIPMQHQTH